MIVGIEGTIQKKEPTLIHVNVNGLVYEVFISINTFHALESESVKMPIHCMDLPMRLKSRCLPR
jgi:holliday junction DNA helicase RuvA